jgi:hypothetical protein
MSGNHCAGLPDQYFNIQHYSTDLAMHPKGLPILKDQWMIISLMPTPLAKGEYIPLLE